MRYSFYSSGKARLKIDADMLPVNVSLVCRPIRAFTKVNILWASSFKSRCRTFSIVYSLNP